MKTTRVCLVFLLLSGLLAMGTAQAFCFSIGNKHSRFNGYNSYPIPAVGFTPQSYPYSAMPVTPWYDGNGKLVSAPEEQDNGLNSGARSW
jgi:hypothetical protein